MLPLPLVALIAQLLTCTAATPTSDATFDFKSGNIPPAVPNGPVVSSSLSRAPTSPSVELDATESRANTAVMDTIFKAEVGGKSVFDDASVANKGWITNMNHAAEELKDAATEKQRAAVVQAIEAVVKKEADVAKAMGAVVATDKEIYDVAGGKVQEKTKELINAEGSYTNAAGARPNYKLTQETLRQLKAADAERHVQIPIYNANKAAKRDLKKELRRDMDESVPDLKSSTIVESRTGRDTQVYDKGRRVLSCSIVSNLKENKNHQVLLISSSNPNKNEWILPKGGWENDENLFASARREIEEEGGVAVNENDLQYLGKRDIKISAEAEKGVQEYVYHTFTVDAADVKDQWAESTRQRIWVSFDDAIFLLQKKRPHMADLTYEAMVAKKSATAVAFEKRPNRE